MSTIQKREFSPEYINEKNYIESLLNLAVEGGYINESMLSKIEQELGVFLQASIYRFRKSGFSSLTENEIEEIANGVLYILSLKLKAQPPQKALDELTRLHFDDIFKHGIQCAQALFLSARKAYLEVKDNLFLSDNYFFQDEIKNDMPLIFNRYAKVVSDEKAVLDLYLCADEFDAGYPVTEYRINAPGIERVESYITSFRYENDFLRLFNPKAVSEAVESYFDFPVNAKSDHINIFQPVLFTSLKMIVLGKNPATLNISKEDEEQFSKINNKEELLIKALNIICESNGFSEEHKTYYSDIIKNSLF